MGEPLLSSMKQERLYFITYFIHVVCTKESTRGNAGGSTHTRHEHEHEHKHVICDHDMFMHSLN